MTENTNAKEFFTAGMGEFANSNYDKQLNR
jgi:hypothetical protein